MIFSTDDNDPIVYCDRCGIIVHESKSRHRTTNEEQKIFMIKFRLLQCRHVGREIVGLVIAVGVLVLHAVFGASRSSSKISDGSRGESFSFLLRRLVRCVRPKIDVSRVGRHWNRVGCTWSVLSASKVFCSTMNSITRPLTFPMFQVKSSEIKFVETKTPLEAVSFFSSFLLGKMCQICELRSGVTVSCDAGLCPNAFHLSCAHRNGLLQIRGELVRDEKPANHWWREREASVCSSADICPSKSKQMCGEMRNSAFGVDVLDQQRRLSFDQIEREKHFFPFRFVFRRKSNVNCTVSPINRHRTPTKMSSAIFPFVKFNRKSSIIGTIWMSGEVDFSPSVAKRDVFFFAGRNSSKSRWSLDHFPKTFCRFSQIADTEQNALTEVRTNFLSLKKRKTFSLVEKIVDGRSDRIERILCQSATSSVECVVQCSVNDDRFVLDGNESTFSFYEQRRRTSTVEIESNRNTEETRAIGIIAHRSPTERRTSAGLPLSLFQFDFKSFRF